MSLLILYKWRSRFKLKEKGLDQWNASLQPVEQCMLVQKPLHWCSWIWMQEIRCNCLFLFCLMICVQPKKTNFSVKAVCRDYKSLPVVLQFEGQIEEVKEKMLYQKRGTLHFRFSSLIISTSEECFGLNSVCILMLLGNVRGFTKWKCHMHKPCASSHLALWTCSGTPTSWAGCLYLLAFAFFVEMIVNKVVKGNRPCVLWQRVCWQLYWVYSLVSWKQQDLWCVQTLKWWEVPKIQIWSSVPSRCLFSSP